MRVPSAARLLCAAAGAVFLAGAGPIEVDGRISVMATGHGPDVVLIPGLASSAHVWDRTVAALAPHYRLHVVQVAGFAGAPPRGNGSGAVIGPTVAAIHDYISQAHLHAPAVIGHSLGGLMGMELALGHPGDVGRLMIVDSLPFFGMLMGPQATVATVTPRAQALRATLAGQTQTEFATAEPAVMRTLIKSSGTAAQAAVQAASASDHRVVAEAMAEDFATDLRGDLAKITQPVTVLYPWDAATGAPQAVFDQLYRSAFAALPHGSVKRIDGSFHFIMIDQPEAFQGAADAFLAGGH